MVANHLFNGNVYGLHADAQAPKIAFLLGVFDKELRKIHANYWRTFCAIRSVCFNRSTSRAFGIVQAPDILEDGRQDMCDSCPDMTVWDGKLVHSCRMEEWRLYGSYVTVQPLEPNATTPPKIRPEEIPVPSRS